MTSLLLVGCGKMGSALLDRWKRSPVIPHFHVIDPHHVLENGSLVTWHRDIASLPGDYTPDVVVFAIKPQELDTILPQYRKRFSGETPLYISIAAGKTLAFYARHLGEHAHVIRAMPNTPAMIGEGMTVMCAASTLPTSARRIGMDLMSTVGKAEWLPDESLMDCVTAISGCGPAYVFLFMESLVKAGVAIGLPETMTRTLVQQTVTGSIALYEQSGKTFEHLRQQVASPGGATEAALAILMKDNAMAALMEKAIRAARSRSEELK